MTTKTTLSRRLALAVLFGCALLAWGAVPASAAHRTHLSTFGSLSSPQALTVDSNGDVYVVDAGDNTIERFDSTGNPSPFSALGGSNVLDGAGGADQTPDNGFSLDIASQVAVDNSGGATDGTIYVADAGGDFSGANEVVDVFAPSGSYVGQLDGSSTPEGEWASSFAYPCGVAVDPAGRLYVATAIASTIDRFAPTTAPVDDAAANYQTQVSGLPFGVCGLAADSTGAVYSTISPTFSPGPLTKYSAADFGTASPAGTEIVPNATAVAVDPANDDVYADEGNQITQFDSTGAPIISFGGANLSASAGVAVAAGGSVYATDTGDDKVHVFGPLRLGPIVSTDPATAITDTSAILNGVVNPDGLALTDCHFEYVTETAYQADVGNGDDGFSDLSSGGSKDCTPAFGSIPGDSLDHPVSAAIGLSAGTAYRFRLVGANAQDSEAGNSKAVGFEITSFDGGAFDQNGDPVTQAGSHPSTAQTTFYINRFATSGGKNATTETIKDVSVELPPGLIGNPQAIPTCDVADFARLAIEFCPIESQVGVADVWRLGYEDQYGSPDSISSNIYNLTPPKGVTALLGFSIIGEFPIYVEAKLRSGGDYGVTATSLGASQFFDLEGVTFTIWGVPADPSHDSLRQDCFDLQGKHKPGCSIPSPGAADPRAFFTLPTSCIGPVRTGIDVLTWEGGEDRADFLSHDNTLPTPNPTGNDGCNALDFSPTLRARPTTNVADSPTGLDVDLHIPQDDITDPNGTVSAHLRHTTVTLPEGLVINPSGANGLDGCSAAQIDIRGPEGDRCPDASKVGTVSIETPLLDHPVPGAVYVAKPFDNPFNSLLAIYVVVDDPVTGIVVKLAGHVVPNPQTGRLVTTFENNPQLPFEDFHLDFFGGAGGSLKTPATCGTYSTTSSLTPWSAPDSGPPAEPSDTWSIDQAPSGGSCATSAGAQPHTPSFDAGMVSPIAGAHSPFVVNLRRDDGSQEFSAVTVSPPQGLVAKLAGTEICSDGALAAAESKTGQQERASPSCPTTSEVGNVTAAAGAGPAPYYAPGKVYMAGPYKGAPLSFAVITPATAGPFDLGTIVVKVPIYVNSKTAEITAKADPVPSILQGIPLDVRSIHLALDKPNFTLSPTSCNPMAVNGLLTSTIGQVASLSSRFQLAECGQLGFKPKMVLKLRGGTKRGKHPALTIALMPRPGDANIASFSLAMPRSEFLENAHIRTICTRPDFAADNCPAGAIYGEATVTTPILDYPLSGHVYLRSSDNLLPDVVPDLRGPAYQPIKLETAGRTDSIGGGIRNTLDFVPDAPFTKALVQLQGGAKGLLVNSRNICDRIYRATVNYTAHNGDTFTARPALRAKCGKKAKKGKRRSHRRG